MLRTFSPRKGGTYSRRSRIAPVREAAENAGGQRRRRSCGRRRQDERGRAFSPSATSSARSPRNGGKGARRCGVEPHDAEGRAPSTGRHHRPVDGEDDRRALPSPAGRRGRPPDRPRVDRRRGQAARQRTSTANGRLCASISRRREGGAPSPAAGEGGAVTRSRPSRTRYARQSRRRPCGPPRGRSRSGRPRG